MEEEQNTAETAAGQPAAEPSPAAPKLSAAVLPKVPPARKPGLKPTKPGLKPTGPAEDPSWWRAGWIPLVVLVLVAVSADLLWPRICTGSGDFPALGLGAALGGVLYLAAILMLRRDLSRGEQLLLGGMGLVGMVALLYCGSTFAWLGLMLLPLLVIALGNSSIPVDPAKRYRSWWGYWLARRNAEDPARARWRAVLPTLVSVVVGVVLFAAFLGIFASGNPVVEKVFDAVRDAWNRLLEYLNLDWDLWLHVLRWIAGILGFGLLTLRRSGMSAPAAAPAAPAKPAGVSLLPQLPLMSLIGINLAFLVATSTDIAFLWFGKVPEGISQTAYLHDGADSITWASVLAAGILVFLFRSGGSSRTRGSCRFLGFFLVLQTFLLALSVYLRLYHQIADLGFTQRRILAAEFMLLGLAGLVILVTYMMRGGAFRRYVGYCVGIMGLMCFSFAVNPPASLAADLNMAFMDSHRHWKFEPRDFANGRFDPADNLEFALRVYDDSARPGHPVVMAEDTKHEREFLARKMHLAAREVESRHKEDRWTLWNWRMQKNLPAAAKIKARFDWDENGRVKDNQAGSRPEAQQTAEAAPAPAAQPAAEPAPEAAPEVAVPAEAAPAPAAQPAAEPAPEAAPEGAAPAEPAAAQE